ncbi:MAG: HTH domain-containing protein [Verrucomicrobia bacterium]|nr:HTH domain-containing protein [Verrucomicrobiota bacterium]MBU1910299.1 HTH domain-containing protein [Verrucomicrobiota bacterium]
MLPDTVQSAKWEMIEAGGRTTQSFGLGRLFGQIFMLLYLSPTPLSLDDLASQLGVSKASVSIACRQLETWGAVHRGWVKGDRKDYYVAETAFDRILRNGLLSSIYKKLDTAKIQIERSLSLLEQAKTGDEAVPFFRDRLRQAEKYRERINRLLGSRVVKAILRL